MCLGELSRIYVAGSEDIPWSTRARWNGAELVVERPINDSGYVYVPWLIDGHGQALLGTCTLMEREAPYLLEVELARGLLHRLRLRLSAWEAIGMATPEELQQELRRATAHFAAAATQQGDLATAAQHAGAAIAAGFQCANRTTLAYAEQALQARLAQGPSTTLLGVVLGPSNPPVAIRRRLLDFCNLVQLPISWRSVEAREGRRDWKQTDDQLGWCQAAGLKVAAGPLLRLDDRGVPDWMYLWEGDYDNLLRLMLDHVDVAVSRYAGRVHLWHVASRINNGQLLSLNEEQRRNLVAQTLALVRKIDPRTPTVVSFDQPWAEYLTLRDEELAPIHYADALVRSDLGVSGFGLEINAGYYPRGSGQRPMFEYARLFDLWSQLGLPLMLLISAASRTNHDPQAATGIGVELPAALHDGYLDPQQAWASVIAPFALARNNVQVVLWNQLYDGEPHEFPHAGLFDAAGKEKPAIGMFCNLRKNFST